MIGLTVASFLAPLIGGGACLVFIVLFMVGIRLFGPRFIDYHGVVVVAEPPSAAIERVGRAVRTQRDYTYRRIGADHLEVIHSSVEPDFDAAQPSPQVANAFLDILRVSASPVATGTEIELVGRAEARLINAVRTELGHAKMPRLQRPAWMRRG